MARSQRTRACSTRLRGRSSHQCAWGAQGIALWRVEMVAVDDGVEAVLGLGGKTHHLEPLGDEGAQFTHGQRRNPDAGEQARGVQLGELAGGDLVVHDGDTGDGLDVRRMDHA